MNVERPSNKIFKYKEVQAMSDAATKYSDKFEQGNIVDALSQAFEEADAFDVVDRPQHYQFFPGMEAIQVIAMVMTEQQFYGYCLGNRLKYRLRAGNKDGIVNELGKSDKYLDLFEEHKHLCRGARE